MASPSLKIDRARYILTLDPERRIIRDGSIVIEGQRLELSISPGEEPVRNRDQEILTTLAFMILRPKDDV